MRISELVRELGEIQDAQGDLEIVGDTWDLKYLSGCVEFVAGEKRLKLTFSDRTSDLYTKEDGDVD